MMTKAAVLYKGALAQYRVKKEEDGSFVAQLLAYKGLFDKMPPKQLHFMKEGRHCTGDTEEQELMDDLYETVKTSFGGLLTRANGYHLRAPGTGI
jgi:hypothetical protein